jgi:hypothetical protein
MKIPEEVFWNADIHFLDRVVENKSSYDSWFNSAMQKERERVGKKSSKNKIYRRHS